MFPALPPRALTPRQRRDGRKERDVAANPLPVVTDDPLWGVIHEQICLETTRAFELIDVTPRVVDFVRRSGLRHGIVSVQTRHTTTAIVVNEHEPLLIEDLEERLRHWAPEWARYRHDDLSIRTVNLTADERPNGHAHLRALVLGTSESIHVVDGDLLLGRWQRIFFVELDGAQRRTASVVAMGDRGAGSGSRVHAAFRRHARTEHDSEPARCG
jgi:secondary thiamine-phosphate synthase enzyme